MLRNLQKDIIGKFLKTHFIMLNLIQHLFAKSIVFRRLRVNSTMIGAFLKVTAIFFVTISLRGQMTEIPIPQNVPEPTAKSQGELDAEKQDSINQIWEEILTNHYKQIGELKEKVFAIDTAKISSSEAQTLINAYKIDLQNIEKKFTDAKSGGGNSLEIISLKERFYDQQSEIEKRFVELQGWIDTAPKPMNKMVILGIIGGVVLIIGRMLLKIVIKKSAGGKQKAAMKVAEWQTLNMQYQQLPQKLEAAHLPLIENMLMQYTGFIEKPPKKLHKNEALTRIKTLKIKKLKIGPVINIPENRLNDETDIQ